MWGGGVLLVGVEETVAAVLTILPVVLRVVFAPCTIGQAVPDDSMLEDACIYAPMRSCSGVALWGQRKGRANRPMLSCCLAEPCVRSTAAGSLLCPSHHPGSDPRVNS